MDHCTLFLKAPVVDVLIFALLRSIDDLDARAIVGERHDSDPATPSVRGYRTGMRRLRRILEQRGRESRNTDPERAAIRWIDDSVYTIPERRPVRMLPDRVLDRPADTALDLADHDPIPSRHTSLSLDPNAWPSSGPRIQPLPALQAAHRLAPGCDPAPPPARGAGGGGC